MPKTILIVEDDKAILKGLEDNLTREGYRILSARDGKSGLAAVFKNQPDLVLLDVMLPQMGGLEVCRQLKKNGFEAPIFMLTGLADERSRLEGLGLGADDYIPKPFSIREVLLRVKNALKRTEEVLGKAKALDEELKRAKEIQRSSLPASPPKIQRLDIFGMMEPATYVGGDYFDYVVSGELASIIVADVSGKGLPAAMYVQKMQGIVQSSKSRITGAKDILEQLEEHLGVGMEATSFVTATVATFDITKPSVTIANAGHLPVLFRRGKRVEEIKPDGLWIGSLSRDQFSARLETREIELRRGDTLFMISDGVIESMNERGEEFGLDRVKRLLAASSTSARNIVHTCFRRIETFSMSAQQHDDITIVGVRITS